MNRLIVVILTLNEEINIRKAIASVGGRAPVLVFDSGSSDRTLALAQDAGAEIQVRPFDNYANQRNAALEAIQDRYEWAFFLDADEELTPQVWNEIERVTSQRHLDGAYIGYSLVILDHEFRHGSGAQASILRLMRTEHARFVRETNERVDDRELATISLSSKLRHADLKPVAAWFRKHITYAEREARHALLDDHAFPSMLDFEWSSPAERASLIRAVYHRLPLFVRPWLNFGRCILIHRAWRDGVPGLMLAAMQSLWYPMLIDLLIYEARRRPSERVYGHPDSTSTHLAA